MGIELFRGIAALMVLMTHYARFVTTGETGLAFLWTGVDMFFVISGFVFAPMVFADRAGRVAVRPYLVRRFFRIYPLYLLAVLCYFFWSPEASEKGLYLLRHLLFLHTTGSFEEAYFFNPAFWSLPVEIEFYLALPLLALLGGARGRLALLFAGSLVLSYFLYLWRGPEADLFRILSVHLTGILPEFFVGIFLYHFVQRERAWPWTQQAAVALGGAILVAFGYLMKYGGLGLETLVWLNAPFNFLCALGYGMLMFPVLLVRDERWKPGLAALAVFCGSISYGVYLFHNLVPRVLAGFGLEERGWDFFALCTLLTLAVALLGYRLVENPARLYGRGLSRRMLHGRREALVSPTPRIPV